MSFLGRVQWQDGASLDNGPAVGKPGEEGLVPLRHPGYLVSMARAEQQVGFEDPDPVSGRRVDGQGFNGGWPDSRDGAQPVARISNLSSERCTPDSLQARARHSSGGRSREYRGFVRGQGPFSVFSRQNLPLIAPLWKGDQWVPGSGHGHKVLARG